MGCQGWSSKNTSGVKEKYPTWMGKGIDWKVGIVAWRGAKVEWMWGAHY